MKRKTKNLKLSLPRCQNCRRHWHPEKGVIAFKACCSRCVLSRRAAVEIRFELKPILLGDLQGAYLLPRRLRIS